MGGNQGNTGRSLLMRALGGILGAACIALAFGAVFFMDEFSTVQRILGAVSFFAIGASFLQYAFTGRESIFTPRHWDDAKNKNDSTAGRDQ